MILIPEPQEIIYREDCFECAFGTYIVCGEGVEYLPARQLRDCVRQWAGLELAVVKGKARRGDIALALAEGLKEQEYRRRESACWAETEQVFCTACRHCVRWWSKAAHCFPG